MQVATTIGLRVDRRSTPIRLQFDGDREARKAVINLMFLQADVSFSGRAYFINSVTEVMFSPALVS